MTRHIRAGARPVNPTITERQLTGERNRRDQAEHDAALTICDRAVAGDWTAAEVLEAFRIVFEKDTLSRWGIAPDPVQPETVPYRWGAAKGEQAG